jgi:transcriptional regulator GlxA family with amidase domain
MPQLNVAILLFENVEVLDFAGPFEVFSRTRTAPGTESRRSDESAPFSVFTVAAEPGVLRATGGLQVVPDYDFADVPAVHILVVPGGFGTRPLLEDAVTLDWIRDTAAEAKLVTSVCTGSLLLARAGLLDGRRATTHWAALELLEQVGRGKVTVERGKRWVEDGVITSGGVAAGIDMAFAVVAALCGSEVAEETARYIEYPWQPGEAAAA